MHKRVGFMGSGAWGIVLADLIARNGHEVTVWSIEKDVLNALASSHRHPKFPDFEVSSAVEYTTDLADVYKQDVLVECVTAKGLRPVCEALLKMGPVEKPFIITSKGIEQGTGFLLSELVEEMFGREENIGYMSGPTLAKEVMARHPTCAVAAARNPELIDVIKDLFGCPYFRVYASSDVCGVALGGAMKNVIAIATGLADGLGYGHNTKAMLITRGIKELARIGKVKGCNELTLFGPAGLGDLIVTGCSNLSRNFQFGYDLAKGYTPERAKQEIGQVVEGAYTVSSAYKLGQKYSLDLPITNAMHRIIYDKEDPKVALHNILEREVKEEME